MKDLVKIVKESELYPEGNGDSKYFKHGNVRSFWCTSQVRNEGLVRGSL